MEWTERKQCWSKSVLTFDHFMFPEEVKQLEKQRKKSYNVTKSYMKKFEGKKTINF